MRRAAAFALAAALAALRKWKQDPIAVMSGTGAVGLAVYLLLGQ